MLNDEMGRVEDICWNSYQNNPYLKVDQEFYHFPSFITFH